MAILGTRVTMEQKTAFTLETFQIPSQAERDKKARAYFTCFYWKKNNTPIDHAEYCITLTRIKFGTSELYDHGKTIMDLIAEKLHQYVLKKSLPPAMQPDAFSHYFYAYIKPNPVIP